MILQFNMFNYQLLVAFFFFEQAKMRYIYINNKTASVAQHVLRWTIKDYKESHKGNQNSSYKAHTEQMTRPLVMAVRS
jgi:hypothetical protein